MVLTFIAGFAATFGAAEGVRAAQNKSRREEHRTRKNNLIVHCAKGSKYSALLEGRRVVLAGEKLYIDTGTEYNVPFGHPFEGYFLPYPSQPFPGLVSTITHEAPIMNWVFVHAQTHELKFGPRAASEGNATGPWDCTRQDKRLTFSGWEGFCAVQEGDFWALYFDRDGDRLKGKISPGTPVIELELLRVEMRVAKPVVVEMSEEEKEKERERKEVEAREQAERAAALRAQEEVLREAIRRAQEEAGRAQGQQSGSDQESENPPRPAQQGAESPQEQSETHPEQRSESPKQQAQPQSTNGKEPPAPNTNGRRKSRPSLNLAPPGSNGTNGSTNGNRNANGKRKGRAPGERSNPSTPTSRNGSRRSESGSERSGSASPNGRKSPGGSNAGIRRGGGSNGRGARSAANGKADSKGAGRGTGRNGRSSGSSDGTPSSSGRSSPPSSYPSDKELPPSPDVD